MSTFLEPHQSQSCERFSAFHSRIASLLGVGADEFVIISEDAWSYQRYNKELPGRVVHFELEEASERAKPFKSREYKELVSRRGALLWRLVSLGFDVLWADSDGEGKLARVKSICLFILFSQCSCLLEEPIRSRRGACRSMRRSNPERQRLSMGRRLSALSQC